MESVNGKRDMAVKRYSRDVFITGGTGYIGRPLIAGLLKRGHRVCALTRKSSNKKLPEGVIKVTGDALDAESVACRVPPSDTFIHLVGTPRPNPWKGKQFREVDLVSIRTAVDAAVRCKIKHFIYISVAHPAPIMREYIEVRRKGEELISASGLNATILRPWYVLGPGHWWPYAFLPAYELLKAIPLTRESARRLDLVTLKEILSVLITAVENPPSGVRVADVLDIRG